ncbi:MAG: tetratricopeptide repeat protein [Thermoplasmataceae archaeon]|jgi:tetratricopeptide (TPR) repeat protein
MKGDPKLKILSDSIEALLLSDEYAGNVMLLGRQGWGQKELLKILAGNLRNWGSEVYEGLTESAQEIEKYEPFNQILDSITKTSKVRELNEILSLMKSHFRGDRRVFLFFSNINLLSDPTRFLLTYFMKSSSEYGISIVCSGATDSESRNGDFENFLDVVTGEGLAKVFNLSKPQPEDFRFVLSNYRFPEDFLNDIYRLSDANFAILDYIIRYYRFRGVIMDNGDIDYRIYRFLLVPTEISQFLGGIIDSLGRTGKLSVALLSFMQITLDPETIGDLLSLSVSDAVEICNELVKMGLVVRLYSKFGMTSKFINPYFKGAIPNEILQEALKLSSKSGSFHLLPVENRIQVLEQSGDFEGISTLVKNEWRTFVRKFTNTQSILNFVQRVQEHIEDAEAKNILSLIRCNAIYNSDDLEKARKCYEICPGYDIDPAGVTLTLASIYQTLGNYSKSVDILETFSSKLPLEDAASGFLNLLIAEASFNLEDYENAENRLKEAIDIAVKSSDDELKARALTLKGNILLIKGDNHGSEECYNESASINRRLGIWLQLSRNLNNLSVLYSSKGRYNEAISILDQLIDNTYLTGDTTLRASAYHSKARIFDILGRREEVADNATKSILTSKIINNSILLLRNKSLLFWHNIRDLSFSSAMEEIREASRLNDKLYSGYFSALGKFMNFLDGVEESFHDSDFTVPEIPDGMDMFQFSLLSMMIRKIYGKQVNLSTEISGMLKYLDDEPALKESTSLLFSILKGEKNIGPDSDGTDIARILSLILLKREIPNNRDSQRLLTLGERISGIIKNFNSEDFDGEAFRNQLKSIWND